MKKSLKFCVLMILTVLCAVIMTGCSSKREKYLDDGNSIDRIGKIVQNAQDNARMSSNISEYNQIMKSAINEIKDIKMRTYYGKLVKKRYIKYVEKCVKCVIKYHDSSEEKFTKKFQKYEKKYGKKLDKALSKFEKKYNRII